MMSAVNAAMILDVLAEVPCYSGNGQREAPENAAIARTVDTAAALEKLGCNAEGQ